MYQKSNGERQSAGAKRNANADQYLGSHCGPPEIVHRAFTGGRVLGQWRIRHGEEETQSGNLCTTVVEVLFQCYSSARVNLRPIFVRTPSPPPPFSTWRWTPYESRASDGLAAYAVVMLPMHETISVALNQGDIRAPAAETSWMTRKVDRSPARIATVGYTTGTAYARLESLLESYSA